MLRPRRRKAPFGGGSNCSRWWHDRHRTAQLQRPACRKKIREGAGTGGGHVLRGDLSSGPLGQLLAELATDSATGCLYVADPLGGETHLYLNEGDLDAVRPAPARDLLCTRLVADGRLRADQLEELSGADDDRSPALAERLLADQLVTRAEIDALALELTLDTLDVACGWQNGPWRFRRRTRAALSLPSRTSVADALAALRDRAEERERLAAEFGVDADALDQVAPTSDAASNELTEASTTPGARAVAELVDGAQDLATIALRTGRSVAAVARLLLELRTPAPVDEPADIGRRDDVAGPVEAESVEVQPVQVEPVEAEPVKAEPVEAEPVEAEPVEAEPVEAPVFAATGRDTTHSSFDALDAEALPVSWNRPNDEVEVSESLAKASQALSEALGDGAAEQEPDRSTRVIRSSTSDAQAAGSASPVDPETAARRERLRAAAAAELAAAHAEAEQARRQHESSERAAVVDLTARREAARQNRQARAEREAKQAREAQERAERAAREAREAREHAERQMREAQETQAREADNTSESAAAARSALSMLNEDPLGVAHLVPTAATPAPAAAEPAAAEPAAAASR